MSLPVRQTHSHCASVGRAAFWPVCLLTQAQNSLLKAIESEKLEVEIDEGGGAFYGPKIDLKINDALGREWQMTTIQFDFNLPERFDMVYIGEDGQRHAERLYGKLRDRAADDGGSVPVRAVGAAVYDSAAGDGGAYLRGDRSDR